MRKILLVTIAFVVTNAAIANPIDTIDYWHVFYNNALVGDFNQMSSSKTVILNERNIKTGDSIMIKYFRDTPCFDCSTFLMVEDQAKRSVFRMKSKGTFTPLFIRLEDLLEYRRNKSRASFEIFYLEEGKAEKIFLFALKIE
jgi:hypothetical protein